MMGVASMPCSLLQRDAGADRNVTVGLSPNQPYKGWTTKRNTMMHCESKPPEESPTDEVAAPDTAGTAAAGKDSKHRCHWLLQGRRDRKEKSNGEE